VFQRQDLAHGRFEVHGEPVDPGAIERTALMTVEGERDDICGPGKTVAAQDLCRNLPAAKKTAASATRRRPLRRLQRTPLADRNLPPRVRDFIRAHS